MLKYEINDEGCLEVDQVIKDLHLSPETIKQHIIGLGYDLGICRKY